MTTKQTDVTSNPNYRPVLDHGFVGVVDHMGSDAAIVQAARVSYGDGTTTVRKDRALIRYLISHKHTSPLEMCEVKLHIKLPIFIMRQWVRHRTASLNEYSGRYSIMSDEFYLPSPEMIAPQSSDNKQGRSGAMSDENKEGVRALMEDLFTQAYAVYERLHMSADAFDTAHADADDSIEDARFHLDEDYPGIAREIARTVLPVANYTELYWKQDLHNLFHLIKLRIDPHAQAEVRAFAQAVYDLLRPLFPMAIEAFDDYVLGAVTLSRMERQLLSALLQAPEGHGLDGLIADAGSAKALAESYDLSLRELDAFRIKLAV